MLLQLTIVSSLFLRKTAWANSLARFIAPCVAKQVWYQFTTAAGQLVAGMLVLTKLECHTA